MNLSREEILKSKHAVGAVLVCVLAHTFADENLVKLQLLESTPKGASLQHKHPSYTA